MPEGYTYISAPYSTGITEGLIGSPLAKKQASLIFMEGRYRATMEYTAWAFRHRYNPLCPILMTHELARFFTLPKAFDYWREWNEVLIVGAKAVHILALPGWEGSEGVTREYLTAFEIGIPVFKAKPGPGRTDATKFILEPYRA